MDLGGGMFTQDDLITELKLHNKSVLLVGEKNTTQGKTGLRLAQLEMDFKTSNVSAPRFRIRRQRSRTLPLIEDVSVNGGAAVKKKPVRLTKSLNFLDENEARRSHTSRRRTYTSGAISKDVTFSKNMTARALASSSTSSMMEKTRDSRLYDRRHTLISSKRNSLDVPHERKSSIGFGSRKSISNGDRNALFTIVKARSLALKWYGGGSRKERRKAPSKVLPTIGDTAKISLCKAKCSPQFAEVVQHLQNDTEDLEEKLEILSLE
ncbi:uncharacterized protein LOC116615456 [Nematostella vectensis]|uniref:uncharacterized protein LOC116615456 n=1 Tax=Nematostella vectensis TaxID=45351 RepID=UPI0020776898|nr:uncharacterized protein LOC116615456 [Nematostella vectensis]